MRCASPHVMLFRVNYVSRILLQCLIQVIGLDNASIRHCSSLHDAVSWHAYNASIGASTHRTTQTGACFGFSENPWAKSLRMMYCKQSGQLMS